ncbi:MAG: alanine and proline-rich secreted protein Apa, partial [Nitrospira sp.]|nr:alanine and proline-rich secreted protein Apa [Nitrospira sp.]
ASYDEWDLLTKAHEEFAKGHSRDKVRASLFVEIEKLKTVKDETKNDTAEKKSDPTELQPAQIDRLLALYEQQLKTPAVLPCARLRSWPWTEERGENPYLLVEGLLRKDSEGHRTVPWKRGEFLTWLISDQLPYLAEPLTKFLAPIVYFFNSSAGAWVRLYLLLVILWTAATWGFFGGAICRLAALEVARNEKLSLAEALAFAREKFVNLFTAPLLPLVFLGLVAAILIVFGWIHIIPVLGELLDVLWFVVLALGIVMAFLLVGLIGWPLMNPTIAAEGSDNFDALSRSYSYVYSAFWHYLGYWATALLYGAALVFFVGFMGSTIVYLGKWGMSQAPGAQSTDPARDRDPAFLFYYAPRSFEWRDLLIKDSPHVERREIVTARGVRTVTYEFTEAYEKNLSWYNRVGAFLVAIWVGLFFTLVIAFGYSYFWTAATVIYLLMRQKVDDTEFEEVFFEEQDASLPASNVVASQTPAAKPGTISLNLVDASAGTVATATAASPPPGTSSTVPTSSPPAADSSAAGPTPAPLDPGSPPAPPATGPM